MEEEESVLVGVVVLWFLEVFGLWSPCSEDTPTAE